MFGKHHLSSQALREEVQRGHLSSLLRFELVKERRLLPGQDFLVLDLQDAESEVMMSLIDSPPWEMMLFSKSMEVFRGTFDARSLHSASCGATSCTEQHCDSDVR